MDKNILNIISAITEEEENILNGQTSINKKIYTEKKEMIVDSSKFLINKDLIEIRPNTRFIHFPKHRHNYVEVIYMCSGTTTHIINNNKIILKEGELLFLNQNATQEVLYASKNDIAINFIIQPEFFDVTLTMLNEKNNLIYNFLIGCLCNDTRYTDYLLFRVSNILPIQNLIENMIWTIINKQINNRKTNQITMGLLFLQLLNYTDKLYSDKNSFEQDLMIQILTYIEENYKNATLTEIANYLNYDIFYLSRIIKKQTNETFKKILKRKRMDKANYLLLNTNLSISNIIEIIGYDNTSYFYKTFKEYFGVSPKEYRYMHCK